MSSEEVHCNFALCGPAKIWSSGIHAPLSTGTPVFRSLSVTLVLLSCATTSYGPAAGAGNKCLLILAAGGSLRNTTSPGSKVRSTRVLFSASCVLSAASMLYLVKTPISSRKFEKIPAATSVSAVPAGTRKGANWVSLEQAMPHAHERSCAEIPWLPWGAVCIRCSTAGTKLAHSCGKAFTTSFIRIKRDVSMV